MNTSFLTETRHRPWPLPKEPYVIEMGWRHLLFAHWPIPPDVMRAHVPPELELDLYDGQAWLGVVPFLMTDVRARLSPITMEFPELNVRTYVKAGGKHGVFFFSLDAASWLTVRAARAAFQLPYFHANMTYQQRPDGTTSYTSVRRTRFKHAEAHFRATYAPTGPVIEAAAGSLEHWLTERYCLFTAQSGRVCSSDVHHLKWPLQPATAQLDRNTMTEVFGLKLPVEEPLLHYAEHLDVVAWRPRKVK